MIKSSVFQLEMLKQSKFQVTLENIKGKQMVVAEICKSNSALFFSVQQTLPFKKRGEKKTHAVFTIQSKVKISANGFYHISLVFHVIFSKVSRAPLNPGHASVSFSGKEIPHRIPAWASFLNENPCKTRYRRLWQWKI